MTVKALTLDFPWTSPATCSRIFTISKGLVNITCDAPACQHRRAVDVDYTAWKPFKHVSWNIMAINKFACFCNAFLYTSVLINFTDNGKQILFTIANLCGNLH